LYEAGDLQTGLKKLIGTQKNGEGGNNMQVVIVRKAQQCNVFFQILVRVSMLHRTVILRKVSQFYDSAAPSKLAEETMFLISIWGIPGSKLGRDTYSPYFSHGSVFQRKC
jgi:hypothetical protein